MAAGTAERTPPRPERHPVAAALAAAIVLAAAGYAAVAADAVAATGAARRAAVLGDRNPASRARLAALPDRQVDTALAASPLSQRLVDVAMVRAVDRGAALEPWLMQVERLGWRDTVSLQNRLLTAARTADLSGVLDNSDALLRRRELVEQVVPALSLVELDPGLRQRLATRLAAGPNWRGVYLFTSPGALRTPEQLEARFALLRVLAASSGLSRDEALTNVAALDAGGRPDLAFALWQRAQPGVVRPLNDPGFVRAARSFRSGEEYPAAYEWQLLSGEGFGAGVSEENGRARLDIDWDGRGVPVFARQRTSAVPGRYALDVRVAAQERRDVAALAFRLLCDGRPPVPLRPVPGGPARFVTDGEVPCAYPLLEIAGDVQPSATVHQIAIEALTLRRLASAG